MRATWVRGIAVIGMLVAGSAWSNASTPTWKVQNTPKVAGFAFNSVSCPARTRCVAVGGSSTDASTVLLVETWAGKTWKRIAVKSPLSPKKGTATLSAVSCPSTSSCVAVGFYTVGTSIANETTKGFSEVDRSGKWALGKTVAVDGPLLAVSCPTAKACVAVGSSDVKPFGPLAEAWNGSAWKRLDTVAVNTESTFAGVSCSSAGHCTAVGNSESKSFQDAVLVERLTGTKWRVQTTPKVAGAGASLVSASCPNSTKCMAVGSYNTSGSSGHSVPLAEDWNGSAWKRVATPKVTGDNPFLAGVSCPAAKSCRAVGTGNGGALAEAWNGKSWSVQSAADPTVNTGLSAVSCTAGPACTGVGLYWPTVAASTPLAERN